MGLDTVELVLLIEEHFQIEIADEAASKITTVGELHEYVYGQLKRRGRTDIGYNQVFHDMRDMLCTKFGVPYAAVVSEARIVKDLQLN